MLFRRFNESRVRRGDERQRRGKGRKREREKGSGVEGDRQIREMRSDFAFFFSSGHSLFTLLHRGRSSECCAILLGKPVRVKSEILFLETVPARYYLLAVFQKKHRRRRRRRSLEACFGIPSTYTSTIPSIPRPSASILPPAGRPTNVLCATVSSTLDRNKKRRETINLNKNTTGPFCMQRPALTA